MPGELFATPPASVTLPTTVPEMTAVSLVPAIEMVTTSVVPPVVDTVNVSVKGVLAVFNACTAVLPLFSV